MGEAMRILYLYLKAEDRFKDHDVREKKVSLNCLNMSFILCLSTHTKELDTGHIPAV